MLINLDQQWTEDNLQLDQTVGRRRAAACRLTPLRSILNLCASRHHSNAIPPPQQSLQGASASF